MGYAWGGGREEEERESIGEGYLDEAKKVRSFV
jgi:hypothetical protein